MLGTKAENVSGNRDILIINQKISHEIAVTSQTRLNGPNESHITIVLNKVCLSSLSLYGKPMRFRNFRPKMYESNVI